MPTTTTRAQRHELHLAVIHAHENLRAATTAYHNAFAAAKTRPLRVEQRPCGCCWHAVYEPTPEALRSALVTAARARRAARERLVAARSAYRSASLVLFSTTENPVTVCHYLHIERIECEVSAPPPGPTVVTLAQDNGRRATVSGVRAACSARTFKRVVAEVEAARLEHKEYLTVMQFAEMP